jgi:hypothetical protein
MDPERAPQDTTRGAVGTLAHDAPVAKLGGLAQSNSPSFTPRPIIGLGGIGGSAAWWSLRNQHAVAYVTRRLHDFSRAAEIAAALGDDITIEVMCQ